MNSPAGQTRRRIFMLDGSSNADLHKDVPLEGFVDIDPHFWGEIPPNPQFWCHELAFIIETTALILTKFCTTIATTKWSSWVVSIVPNTSKMADGCHFEKNR